MDKNLFIKFSDIVYAKSGIVLKEGKEALVSSRLAKRMRSLNISTYNDYLDFLNNDKTGEELTEFLDAISTNVTSFFRENIHFEFLREIFPKWLESGQTKFRIWCAAASTGEEPYTIAMTVLDAIGNRNNIDVKILASDISTKVLSECNIGVYSEKRLESVPVKYKNKYFDISKTNGVKMYKVKPILKNMISFKRLNLSTTPYPMKGPFDVVFCRNVMIYFDNNVRKKLLDEVYRLLKPKGYLFVGHAESLAGALSDLDLVKPATYIKQ